MTCAGIGRPPGACFPPKGLRLVRAIGAEPRGASCTAPPPAGGALLAARRAPGG